MVTKTKAPPDFMAMRLRLPATETDAASYLYSRVALEGDPLDPVSLTTGMRMAARLLGDSSDLALREPRAQDVARVHEMKRAVRLGFRGKVTFTTEVSADGMTERFSSITLHGRCFTFELSLGSETDRQPTHFLTITWDAEKAPLELVEGLFALINMEDEHFDALEPSASLGDPWMEVSSANGAFTVFLMPKPGVESYAESLGEL